MKMDERRRLPIITLSSGDVYTYSEGTKSWIRSHDQAFLQSELHSSLGSATAWSAQSLAQISSDDRVLLTLAHAEHEMSVANVTQTPAQYRQWAILLCRRTI